MNSCAWFFLMCWTDTTEGDSEKERGLVYFYLLHLNIFGQRSEDQKEGGVGERGRCDGVKP